MSRTNIQILKTNSNFIEIRFVSEASAVRHGPRRNRIELYKPVLYIKYINDLYDICSYDILVLQVYVINSLVLDNISHYEA